MKKRILHFVLAFGVTGFLLWRVGPAGLGGALASADLLLIGVAFLVVAAAVFLKAYRFHMIIRRKASLRRLFRIVAFQDALNAFLPARMGDLSYVVMLKEVGIPVGEGIASLALARVGDVLAATAIFYTALIILHDPRLSFVSVALPAAVIFLGALGIIVAVFLLKDRVNSMLNRLMSFSWFPERLRGVIHHHISDLLSGLRAAGDRRLPAIAFSCSILTWIMAALALHLWVLALGSSLSFWQCALIQTLLAVLSLLPLHALLGPAVVEVSLLGLLVLFGVDRDVAMTIVLATAVFLGLYYAVMLPVSSALAPKAATTTPDAGHPSSESPCR